MENNTENPSDKKHFPDTLGSLKIFGLLLLCMLLFAPFLLLFDRLFGRDIGFGVYYLLSPGVVDFDPGNCKSVSFTLRYRQPLRAVFWNASLSRSMCPTSRFLHSFA